MGKRILIYVLFMFVTVISATGCLNEKSESLSSSDNQTESMEDSTDDDSSSEADKENFTVTFDTDEIVEVPSQTVKAGETATKPQDPEDVMKGNTIYKFIGWYNGDDEFDFSSTINADIILSAKWDTEVYTSDIPINK